MRRFFKIVFILIFLVIPFILTPPVKAQQHYVVKPVLVIPKYPVLDISGVDYQELDRELGNQYKFIIINALKEVQQYYAQKLNGKTFIIDEDAFQVIRPERQVPFFTIQTTPTVSRYFLFLGGYDNPIMEENTIRAIWVLGTGPLIQDGRNFSYGNPPGLAQVIDSFQRIGRMIPRGYGEAFLNEENFFSLAGRDIETYSGFPRDRDFALSILAHELGHAIGLVSAGYAEGHPCSDCSTNQCTANAPLPLPSCTVEYIRDIMGYSNLGLHERGFNNSIHNPEIYKLYRNPYINPQGDPAPTPIQTRPLIDISSTSPNPIMVGQTLEIRGHGFGQPQYPFFGRISFTNDSLSPRQLEFGFSGRGSEAIQTGDYEILEWTDNLIRVHIRNSALDKYGQSTNGITFRVSVHRLLTPGDAQRLGGGELPDDVFTRGFYLTIFPLCNSASQPVVLDCSNGQQCSQVPSVNGNSCQWTRQCTNKTECTGLGTGWVGTSGCGNKTDPHNQISEQTQCAFGQRCWADYYRDESTQCQWQPKVNTEGQYAGKTYHCDSDNSCTQTSTNENLEITALYQTDQTLNVRVLEREGGNVSPFADQFREVFELQPAAQSGLIKTAYALVSHKSISEIHPLQATEGPPNTYTITIPADEVPGRYNLIAYMYRQGSDQILDSDEEAITITSVTPTPTSTPSPTGASKKPLPPS